MDIRGKLGKGQIQLENKERNRYNWKMMEGMDTTEYEGRN